MATNHTENYQLNLWTPQDSFLREEFNQNSQIIDAVLGDKVRLVTGRYSGTGKYGPENPTVLEIPDAERPPRLVIVMEQDTPYILFLIRGIQRTVVRLTNEHHYVNVEWTDKGVKWYGTGSSVEQLNCLRSDGIPRYYYAVFI